MNERRKETPPVWHDLLNARECIVLRLLGDAWYKFCDFEPRHPDEADEFKRAIHRAQDLIIARPVMKQVQKVNE